MLVRSNRHAAAERMEAEREGCGRRDEVRLKCRPLVFLSSDPPQANISNHVVRVQGSRNVSPSFTVSDASVVFVASCRDSTSPSSALASSLLNSMDLLEECAKHVQQRSVAVWNKIAIICNVNANLGSICSCSSSSSSSCNRRQVTSTTARSLLQ